MLLPLTFKWEDYVLGRAKVVNWRNNRYKGSLTDDECDLLEELLKVDASNGCVTDLRHVIYDLSESAVNTILDYGFSWEDFKDFVDLERSIGTLEDYQTVGVAYMYWAKRLLLGDSQGMGKTPTSAGLCNLLRMEYEKQGKQFRFLFLTEKTSADQIQKKLIQFTGDYVDFVSGDAKSSTAFVERNPYYPKYSVCGTHSLIKQGIFIEWLMSVKQETGEFPFDIIIVDESTVVGGGNTGYAEGVASWLNFVDRAVFLNATPVETHAKTMYNQLNLLDPTMLPTKSAWSKEFEIMDYRGMFPRPTGKYKNPEEFKRRCAYRYFARTRKDKGAVMEDCTGLKLLSDLSPIQKHWLSRSSIKQLVFDAPNYFDESIEFCSQNVPKLKSLLYLLENDCAGADSIIIFTHYKCTLNSLSDWLSELGISNRVLNGEITVLAERNAIVEGFKRRQFRVLLTNVQKGLDFDNCDHCIFYSFDPNPSKMIQAEGRMERSFDIIGKHVYLLISRGQELSRLEGVIRDRTSGAMDFTNSDYSIIRDIILGEEFAWDVQYD